MVEVGLGVADGPGVVVGVIVGVGVGVEDGPGVAVGVIVGVGVPDGKKKSRKQTAAALGFEGGAEGA